MSIKKPGDLQSILNLDREDVKVVLQLARGPEAAQPQSRSG